jgi:cell division protease FtsH
MTGLEGKCLKDSRSKRLVAYQEIGRAITGTMIKYHDPVEKVTLIPRGQRQGLTWFTPVEDQGLISRGQIIARIIGTLGGRAAEEVIFGEAEITTGASNDIMQCTSMARQMVTRYGMSPVGPMAFEDETSSSVFLDGTTPTENKLTLDTTSRIDKEVQEIITYCHDQARSILSENRVAMDRLVDVLIEEETIEGDKFREILSSYSKIPERVEYKSYFAKV